MPLTMLPESPRPHSGMSRWDFSASIPSRHDLHLLRREEILSGHGAPRPPLSPRDKVWWEKDQASLLHQDPGLQASGTVFGP